MTTKMVDTLEEQFPFRDSGVPLLSVIWSCSKAKRRGSKILAALRYVVLPALGHTAAAVAWLGFISLLCYMLTIAY